MSATTINVPFVRDEWLPALRSGSYEQGRNQLRHVNDTFCCLGVAADLIVKGGYVDGLAWCEGRDSHYSSYGLGASYCYTGALPPKVRDFVGLTRDHEHDLIRLNDGGASFAEIADCIERAWLPKDAGDERQG